jgi:hypothetical protein
MILINPGSSPSPLMQKMRMGVEVRGEIVRLSVGSTQIDMPYEAAIQLSGWLRLRGKEAKKNAGDSSRQWRVIAFLEGLKS